MLNSMERSDSLDDIMKAKNYTIDSLDFAQLDSLGLTIDYINIWAKLYIDRQATTDLAKDSKQLIDRLEQKSPQDVDVFVKGIAHSTVLTDYPNLAASIVAYTYGVDVASDGYSEIATRLFTSSKLTGNLAPPIEGLSFCDKKNTIVLLFYDSSCVTCQQLLEEIVSNYEQLTTKAVRVVSISADGDVETFRKEIEKYPWADKLYDGQSFNGINFKRFGVAATPTMFLIDASGRVVGQFDSLSKTGLIV